jgi:hypothetical protein
MINAYTVLLGKTEEKFSLGDLGLDGRIILKRSLKTEAEGVDRMYQTSDAGCHSVTGSG